MAKDQKGHGSNAKGGMASGHPSYAEAKEAAKKFAKEPSITDKIKAAEQKIGRGTEEGYEAARKSGDRVTMAAHSNLMSRSHGMSFKGFDRASPKVRSTTQNKKY